MYKSNIFLEKAQKQREDKAPGLAFGARQGGQQCFTIIVRSMATGRNETKLFPDRSVGEIIRDRSVSLGS